MLKNGIKSFLYAQNIQGYKNLIKVDGGVNDKVLTYLYNADILVAGAYIANDINNIEKLK